LKNWRSAVERRYVPSVSSTAVAAGWGPFGSVIALVLPGSTGYLPDQIVGLRPECWEPFDLAAGDDEALGADLIGRFGHLLGSRLTVITDASWRPAVGPLTTTAEHLLSVIEGHVDRFGEAFFGGDVVIVSSDTGIVLVVHHNGLIQAVRGRVAG
jgi:hypothetical protein